MASVAEYVHTSTSLEVEIIQPVWFQSEVRQHNHVYISHKVRMGWEWSSVDKNEDPTTEADFEEEHP